VGRASIAQLRIADTDAVYNHVPVRAGRGGYFKISVRDPLLGWHLESATLVTPSVTPAATETVTLAALAEPPLPLPQGAQPPVNALYFDAGGALPVTAVALEFAGGNGWASNPVFASARMAEPGWSEAARSPLAYSVDVQGQAFASLPLEIARREGRYWRVTAAEPIDAGRVSLVLRYGVERIRVSGAGTAPFWLVAGTRAREAGPDPTFARVWRALPPGNDPPLAALGRMAVQGGPAALAAPYEFPWRVTLLWIVLGAGVLAVAWMAVRLARELNEPQA
jgi:hypothetical protein